MQVSVLVWRESSTWFQLLKNVVETFATSRSGRKSASLKMNGNGVLGGFY